MRRHDEDWNARLPHKMLRSAADENMFEPRVTVGRSNDEIEVVRQGEFTYLFDRRPNCNFALRPNAAECHRADEFAHFLPHLLQNLSYGSPRKSLQMLHRGQILGFRVTEIQDVKHRYFRSEAPGELNGVTKAVS